MTGCPRKPPAAPPQPPLALCSLGIGLNSVSLQTGRNARIKKERKKSWVLLWLWFGFFWLFGVFGETATASPWWAAVGHLQPPHLSPEEKDTSSPERQRTCVALPGQPFWGKVGREKSSIWYKPALTTSERRKSCRKTRAERSFGYQLWLWCARNTWTARQGSLIKKRCQRANTNGHSV